MSKRKAAVNDIIYELDNEDVDSSDDECKEKIVCLNEKSDPMSTKLVKATIEYSAKNNDIVSLCEESSENSHSSLVSNGGKPTVDANTNKVEEEFEQCTDEVDNIHPLSMGFDNSISNEDMVIDSPTSNSDLGVVGCENRTPLITVRFKDCKLAKNYKKKLKEFMLNLIKLHDKDFDYDSEADTDLELDIWPEDIVDESLDSLSENNPEDSLYFVDTDPTIKEPVEIPTYKEVSTLISNVPVKEPTPPPIRRGPTCFNCDGAHSLRDCPLPRNNAKIAESRKNVSVRVGRYHVEDEQKYGHLIPGRISGKLRHALGLKRNELPLHIYRMRNLGYPPGWLEEARISHSGITMFDSAGNAIQDPEEEDGELCEPGCKDKFDIKKILDFPGFNVPTSSKYKEEGHLLGVPPMLEHDSKEAMLQMLAPNAMKAYKRKKLTLFPSAINNSVTMEGQAEMELDSGDEIVEFPSVPPLPDEEPPAPPPPPPPPPKSPPLPPKSPSPPLPKSPQPPPPGSSSPLSQETNNTPSKEKDDVEIVGVLEVKDIPIPPTDLITIDEDDCQSGRNSPSLDDLEMKKKMLLDALGGANPESPITNVVENKDNDDVVMTIESQNSPILKEENEQPKCEEKEMTVKVKTPQSSPVIDDTNSPSDPDVPKTPNSTGHVKTTAYGTPVLNIASPYVKLPSDDKFSKDICDIINFENLPNSTGKYKQISSLLKKVKSEVDRIQDS